MRPRQTPSRLRPPIAYRFDQPGQEALFYRALESVVQERHRIERGESLVPWFCRKLHHATSRDRLIQRPAASDDVLAPPLWTEAHRLWERPVRDLVSRLLPRLNSRYAEIIRRVDLGGEMKLLVAAELKVSRATFNVMLHRARRALRRELERYCGEFTGAPRQQL